MKTLSLRDIERYYTFICRISQIMKTDFEDKMEKCYIYNAPFVFSQLIKLISKFIDKKTQDKIQLVDEWNINKIETKFIKQIICTTLSITP